MASSSKDDCSECNAPEDARRIPPHIDEAPLWLQLLPHDKVTGPHSAGQAVIWYENRHLWPSSRFSFDRGQTWHTLDQLRRRNGARYPFYNGKIEPVPKNGGIGFLGPILNRVQLDVDGIQGEYERLNEEVNEAEHFLEEIKSMQREIDRLRLPTRDSFTQIEPRYLKVGAKLFKENKARELQARKCGKQLPIKGKDQQKEKQQQTKKELSPPTTQSTREGSTETRTSGEEAQEQDGMAAAIQKVARQLQEFNLQQPTKEAEVQADMHGCQRVELVVEGLEPSQPESKDNGEEKTEKDEKKEEKKDGKEEEKPHRTPTLSPIKVARPSIMPMLQASIMPNDYSGGENLNKLLRSKIDAGIHAAAIAATSNHFNPPPVCQLCEDALPLVDLPSFFDHVLSPDHVNKIMSSGGRISAGQVFYWIDVVTTGFTCRPAI